MACSPGRQHDGAAILYRYGDGSPDLIRLMRAPDRNGAVRGY